MRTSRGISAIYVATVLALSAACSSAGQRPLAELSPIERDAAAFARTRGEAATPDLLTGTEIQAGAKLRIEELLQARIPGVRVIRTGGDGFTVRIRGGGAGLRPGAAGERGEPLFIVDGIELTAPASATLRFIKPVEVESIKVIKDGMASAYGARGASGVIIITTASGR